MTHVGLNISSFRSKCSECWVRILADLLSLSMICARPGYFCSFFLRLICTYLYLFRLPFLKLICICLYLDSLCSNDVCTCICQLCSNTSLKSCTDEPDFYKKDIKRRSKLYKMCKYFYLRASYGCPINRYADEAVFYKYGPRGLTFTWWGYYGLCF